MTKKKETAIVIIGLIISLVLVFGIFKMKENHKIKLENKKEVARQERLEEEKIEKEKQMAIEKEKIDKAIKEKDTGKTGLVATEDDLSETATPEVKVKTDENGNKITTVDVPGINPKSSPEDAEKPNKPTSPKKTEDKKPSNDKNTSKPNNSNNSKPKTDPSKPNNTSTSKPSNNNTNTSKPSKPNNTNTSKPNTNNSNNTNNKDTGKKDNPFLNFETKDPSEFNEVNSEDIGDPNMKPGQGDKF